MYTIFSYQPYYRKDEKDVVFLLKDYIEKNNIRSHHLHNDAVRLHETSLKVKDNFITKILNTYKLNTEEGKSLMSLAEALIRIPDVETKDVIIKDKLSIADWKRLDTETLTSWFSKYGLHVASNVTGINQVVGKLGKVTVRTIVLEFVKAIGANFVLGENIIKAKNKSKLARKKGYSFSFDMLGERAVTQQDADKYYNSYNYSLGLLEEKDNLSIKLSALHPRYEYLQQNRVVEELTDKLVKLIAKAEENNVTLTIDAEEADKLDLSFLVIKNVLKQYKPKPGVLGFALQAYQKRAFWVIDYIVELAREYNTKFNVRLVKGAYWDTEIKIAQELGLDYPVFTNKNCTDISYVACAIKMKENLDYIYPAFATHNPFTATVIMGLYNQDEFEFQRLHGMGEGLHNVLVERGWRSRIYAPVGIYKDLLAYLVRRLLENGANTSFLNIQVVTDLFSSKEYRWMGMEHTLLPTWKDVFKDRKNSKGLDITCPETLNKLLEVDVDVPKPTEHKLSEQSALIDKAHDAFLSWKEVPVRKRTKIIRTFADKLEEHMPQLINLMAKEAHKTLADSIAEIREAVDFCRYYSNIAEEMFVIKTNQSVTGELNQYSYKPRGVWTTINPWNFPVAIFVGPMVGALVSGNTVMVKPAEQTTGIATYVFNLLKESGLPDNVANLANADRMFATGLVVNQHVKGVSFTGSEQAAKKINETLATRETYIKRIYAETAGVNWMIIDSSALLEQAVIDTVAGAFNSAGQRCSATRIVAVHEGIYDDFKKMLIGATKELKTGLATDFTIDVGPIIDKDAYDSLISYNNAVQGAQGVITPCIIEIDNAEEITEQFGPILHILRFTNDNFSSIINTINRSEFGLTLGIQSRVPSNINYIVNNVNVGNVYINRNQIGAVVESQPFGGVARSGTGPKAGGPEYLKQFVWEQAISNNITAIGGNLELLS